MATKLFRIIINTIFIAIILSFIGISLLLFNLMITNLPQSLLKLCWITPLFYIMIFVSRQIIWTLKLLIKRNNNSIEENKLSHHEEILENYKANGALAVPISIISLEE